MTNQELSKYDEAIRGRCFPLGSLIKSTKVAWEAALQYTGKANPQLHNRSR